MLARGARVNYVGRYARTALDLAKYNGDNAMIVLLKKAGGKSGSGLH